MLPHVAHLSVWSLVTWLWLCVCVCVHACMRMLSYCTQLLSSPLKFHFCVLSLLSFVALVPVSGVTFVCICVYVCVREFCDRYIFLKQMSFSFDSSDIWCSMSDCYNNVCTCMYIYSSPFEFVLCLVLSVLSSFQFIVCLEELLSQFIDLTFRLLWGALLLCSLHLGLQPLQLSKTPLCISQKLDLTVLGTVGWNNDLSMWYAVYINCLGKTVWLHSVFLLQSNVIG